MRREEFVKKSHSAVLVCSFTQDGKFNVPEGYDGSWITNPHSIDNRLIDEFGPVPDPKAIHSLLLDCEPAALIVVVDEAYIKGMWIPIIMEEYGAFTGTGEQMDFVSGVILNILTIKGVLIPGLPINIIYKTNRNLVLNKPWIHGLSVRQVRDSESVRQIFAQTKNTSPDNTADARVSLIGNQNEKYLYPTKIQLYKAMIKDVPGSDQFLLTDTAHLWILGFWLNLFDTEDIITALTAAFDYFDFLLRLAVYYLRTKEGALPEGRLSEIDVQALAKELIDRADRNETPDEVASSITEMRLEITDHIRALQEQMEKTYGYDIQGDRFNLLGLCGLVRRMRNDMKGHGYMRKEASWYAWELMMHYISMLHVILNTAHFYFSYEGISGMEIGWDGETLIKSLFFETDDGKPCLAWNCRRDGSLEYINYYSGKYIIPSLTLGGAGK